MVDIDRVCLDIVDHDFPVAFAHFVAKCAFDLKLSASTPDRFFVTASSLALGLEA